MKFCYCPKCKELRPKGWHSSTNCYKCQDECIIYQVPRTALGYLMYLCDLIAAGMLVLYVAYYHAEQSWASFIGSVNETVFILALFGFIALSFVFGFVDLKYTTERAWNQIPGNRKD